MPTSDPPSILPTPAPSSQEPALLQSVSRNFRTPSPIFWLLACLLFALVQLPWAGYSLGVGNQGIQIAFLEKLHDPALFKNDPMVRETLGSYPSYFFRIVAVLLNLFTLPTLYLLLHLLATAGVFASVVFLARSVFGHERGGGWTGLITILILLAGHHQALAGETLYSAGFTHTWAVFPLSLCALALFYRERYAAAFLLTGLIFNLHALEAGHLLLIMGAVSLLRIRTIGIRKLIFCGALFLIAAFPTLMMMVRQRQQFDAEWLQLMHIRSADHSFPSTWWSPATPNVPLYACILALATLALSFPPALSKRRTTLLLAAAVGGLFIIGTLFTEWHAIPTVIRAQFFRSSRLLMILAFLLIAHGAAIAWRLPFKKNARLARWQAWLEFIAATLIILNLALPAFLAFLPLTLAFTLLVALINARLTWWQALTAGAALVTSLLAWQTIHFVIPGFPPATNWHTLVDWRSISFPNPTGLALLGAAITLYLLSTRPLTFKLRLPLTLGATVATFLLTALFFPTLHSKSTTTKDPWTDIQQQARLLTPPDALLLTPPQQSGFRINSQRSIVGEWRDGTQLYFAAPFAKTWWDRMNALKPGMVIDADGKSLLTEGKPFERLDDPQVITLAKQFGAAYIILPHDENRSLEKVYDNKVWAIYRPEVSVVSMGIHSTELPAEDQFLRETALPNIDKFRKSDALLTIVDSSNQPLYGAQYKIIQTASPFSFGVTLPFFKRPAVDTRADFKPHAVTEKELLAAADVFNATVLQFSGQWRFTEPTRGKPDYTDLDGAVNWLDEHNINAEFHPLAGYNPPWFRNLPPAEQTKSLLARTKALAERYGKRIESWELPTQSLTLDQATQLIPELRKAAPTAKIGLTSDARFFTPHAGAQAQQEKFAGLDDLRRLKEKNIPIDFFAIPAKSPTGLWASGKEIYALLDEFSKQNIPLHITQFGIPVGERIEGTVRDGTWTPELQAEYYERFFTLCFSHPSVDMINVVGIGPKTWLEGEGLLDANYKATPAYDALQRLITNRWRTRLNGSLSVEGTATFRGFHGTYLLNITLPDGNTVSTTFTLDKSAPNHFRYRYDTTTHQLTRAE